MGGGGEEAHEEQNTYTQSGSNFTRELAITYLVEDFGIYLATSFDPRPLLPPTLHHSGLTLSAETLDSTTPSPTSCLDWGNA